MSSKPKKLDATLPLEKKVETILAEMAEQSAEQNNEKCEQLCKEYPDHAMPWLLYGIVAANQNDKEAAVRYFQKTLEKDPQNIDARNNLGVTLLQLDRPQEAEKYLKEVLSINADNAEVYFNLGNVYNATGEFDLAEENYRKCISLNPNKSSAHNNIGVILKERENYAEAKQCFEKSIEIDPGNFNAINNMGTVHLVEKQLFKAEQCFNRVISINPGHVEAIQNMINLKKLSGKASEVAYWTNHLASIVPASNTMLLEMGLAHLNANQNKEAIECFEKALETDEKNLIAMTGIAKALGKMYQYVEAEKCFQKLIAVDENNLDSFNYYGELLLKLGRNEDALDCFKRAAEIDPDCAPVYNNMGVARQFKSDFKEAIKNFKKSIELDPSCPDPYVNLGVIFQLLDRHIESIEYYAKAQALNPKSDTAVSQKLHQQAKVCDWSFLDELKACGKTLGLGKFEIPVFSFLAMEDNPPLQRMRAENTHVLQATAIPLPLPPKPKKRPKKLKIGYVAANYHLHAMMFLMAKMFDCHDRDKFETYAYSHGFNTNDYMRQRVSKSFTTFRDVYNLSDTQIVELMRNDGIDIAIDLMGYTTYSRSHIFSYRLAPIQISYLGFPGSLGSPHIDYIIADKVVIPEYLRDHYTENVIYMPDSYFVVDDSHKLSDKSFKRSDFGLPEDGIVLACFNATHKILPREFDIWMRILNKVEGSVLWLLGANQWAEINLRKEAEKRGVSSDRIIFAPRAPNEEHVARQALADLFVDTFCYNAHTTATDAMWAGLPIVTKQGRQFAARVASSILTATDMPELITHTDEQYEALILDLITHPKKLQKIRAKLAKNVKTKPMFNTELFTRHIEKAYEMAYDRYFEGLEPSVIHVERQKV